MSLFIRGGYFSLRAHFEKIYDKLVINYHSKNSNSSYAVKVVKEYFKNANFIVFLDGHFDNQLINDDIISTDLKISIPKEEYEDVLRQFYEVGADVYEATDFESSVSISGDASVSLGGLTFSIRLLDTSKEMINSKRFSKTFDGYLKEYISIPTNYLNLCYKKVNENIYVETPEYMFVDAINSGKPIDYIEAFTLKNSVNMKKVSQIRSKIDYNVVRTKEEKRNGLQKIS